MAEPEPDPSPRAQPVGVGAARAMWETSDEPLTEPIPREAIAVPADTSPHVDRPVAELAVGLFALLLALSVFLPWYHNVVGTVSGWSSGTWGPIVFFAALTALAIVGLRRAGIAIDFPVEPTLVIEIIGWVCVVALILKRYRVPQVAGIKLPTDGWIFASLVCALGLAVTAGWASSNAPFVVRKAWFRDPAGRLGTAVIAVALAGGLGFGFANAVSAPTSSAGTPTVIPQLVRGVPKCAGKLHIPTPQGYTATQGYDFKNQPTNCVVYYTTSLKLDTALSRMVSTLRASGWTVTQGRPTPISRTLAISGRGCGAVQLITQAGRPTTVYLNVLPCPKPSK